MHGEKSELTPKRTTLLNMLMDGGCHSGEKIARTLGMTRAGVSKHISVLRQLGLDIKSTTGLGYQLQTSVKLLNDHLLASRLVHVSYYPVIGSTNDYLMERLPELQLGHVCVAEAQTKGRGRRGKAWVSPLCGQIIFSLYWRLTNGMAAATGLSLVVGLSIVNTLSKLGIKELALKWPNDIYARGKKLAGILVELTGSPSDQCDAVIGVGLNSQIAEQSGLDITQSWIDLARLVQPGQHINRTDMICELVQQLRSDLERYNQQGFSGFAQDWQQWDFFHQKPVMLIKNKTTLQGIARGVNKQGALRFETQDGKMMDIYSGDVSLRPAE